LTAIENTRPSVLETGNSADSIANAPRFVNSIAQRYTMRHYIARSTGERAVMVEYTAGNHRT